MRRILFALVLLIPAVACSQPAPPSAAEQACNIKLGAEITQGLQYSAALIQKNAEVERASARIKELEAKYEPKPAAEKK